MNSFLTPFRESIILKTLFAIALFLYSLMTSAQIDKNSDLFKTLKSKDSILFASSFNNCEIEKFEPIIAENFEFYHDLGGVQNKEEFIAVIKNNLCTNPGMNQRSLVDASLEVFEMKKNNELYGAIQKGKHTFQQKINDKMITVGIADFTHLWILENNQWKLKRVLSYNHQPLSE
jgi:hypothetical protein